MYLDDFRLFPPFQSFMPVFQKIFFILNEGHFDSGVNVVVVVIIATKTYILLRFIYYKYDHASTIWPLM